MTVPGRRDELDGVTGDNCLVTVPERARVGIDSFTGDNSLVTQTEKGVRQAREGAGRCAAECCRVPQSAAEC